MKVKCKKKVKVKSPSESEEDNSKWYEVIQILSEQLNNHKPDTSNDGVSYIETEDGVCVQVVVDGNYTWMSVDMFEQLKGKKDGK